MTDIVNIYGLAYLYSKRGKNIQIGFENKEILHFCVPLPNLLELKLDDEWSISKATIKPFHASFSEILFG